MANVNIKVVRLNKKTTKIQDVHAQNKLIIIANFLLTHAGLSKVFNQF